MLRVNYNTVEHVTALIKSRPKGSDFLKWTRVAAAAAFRQFLFHWIHI